MRYKKLLVSGCSFTFDPDGWAFQLSSKYGLDLINLACPGAGNNHIPWSLVSYLEKNSCDPEDTLIGIMWSHPIRTDLMFEGNSEYKDQSVYKYQYDEYNRLVLLGELLRKDEHTQRTAVNNSLMQGNKNKSSFAFRTWMSKTLLTSYLKNKGFTFFQTAFFNYLTQSNLIKGLPDFHFQTRFHYLKELERIGLTHNLEGWINLKDQEYLGEYSFHKKLLNEDKFHPSVLAHKLWTEEILIPQLSLLLEEG